MTRSAQGRKKNVDKKDTCALQHQDTNDWIMTMGDPQDTNNPRYLLFSSAVLLNSLASSRKI